ncbi:phosphatidylglycerol:prolipoprotein diacylglycerol transferase [Tahibacter aquaticus]|uniref:Phosphatidylglycerol--prolipoprotein diacylglyceryl transferase n=1 Tax=Tahibacter aquaticus TaxID=520092 RepID=A0A4R6YTJ3_9GAMM|nr:prolipoprotein diacylglyceryl transferase [Tahibacter aquaticus]TDR41614.1 phosphatidylglycerol:prolipoprotein diacylglycerol transferase [Tahibacter aquaticus]
MPYFHDINPIAVSLGPISIHWYGLMYVLGGVFAWWLGKRRLAQGRLPVSYDQYSDLIFYGMIGVILGGRIGYMLFYGFEQILQNPLALFKVWEGGMSFHGGLLGVVAAGWFWSRRNNIHFFDTMDFVSPLVPIGLGFGRLGNFVGGELWGQKTDQAWGVIFPRALEHLNKSQAELVAMYQAGQLNGEARHPSQLYEMLLEGVVLFLVLWFCSARPRRRYVLSGLFALLYGAFRFGVEFVRQPDAQLGYLALGWLTMGQILSLPLILLGIYLLWRSRGQPQPAAA